MTGHIKLGAPGSLRDYMIADLNLYAKSPANQFAAKLATGAGNYNDLQNWSYWVMDDWQAGVGKRDAEAGGFLYAEAESRYPNELRLPRQCTMGYGLAVAPTDPTEAPPPTGTITIGTTQTYRRVAHKIFPGATAEKIYVLLWVDRDNLCTSVKVSLYTDTGTAPGTSVTSDTITIPDGIGYCTLLAELAGPVSSGTNYVTVEPTTAGESLRLLTFTHTDPNYYANYNGTAWSSTATGFVNEVRGIATDASPIAHLLYFNDYAKLVVGCGPNIYGESAELNGLSLLAGYTDNISAMVQAGNLMLFGQGNSQDFISMESDGVTFVTYGGKFANLLYLWNGYIFRTVENDLYYSGDLSTWTGPITFCRDGYQIRGLCGLNDYLYVSCDDGLFYLGAGDEVVSVYPWAAPDATNGKHMINYHGALFISLGESIIRYDGNTFMGVGLDLGQGLPADRAGTVAAMVAQNNWLYCAINANDGADSVWAYNDQGWHFVALLPEGATITAMAYRRDNKRLYIGTDLGLLWTVYAPDVAKESLTAAVVGKYRPYGWIETDWFYGGLIEVQKDFESVYITGENFSATQYAKVYWQDDDSMDWELLGTITTGRAELRWDDYATRPNTRQLRLGIALFTTLANYTPSIRAIRLKYHPMVSDWFRWSFPLLISDTQQEVSGSINAYTAAQKAAHLDGLITQVPPFVFEDVDGVQYECKVMGCQIQIQDVEWVQTELSLYYIYNLTIEAIRNGTYEP